MKRLCALLIAVILLSGLITACGEPDAEPAPEGGHILYVRDDSRRNNLQATFMSTGSDVRVVVPLERIDSGDSYDTYRCVGDPDNFNRVMIAPEGEDAPPLAYNVYVSGWWLTPYRYEPFTYDEPREEPQVETVSFDYEDTAKKVYIRTPADYDPNGTPCSVIYMTDGQNLFDRNACSTGSWGASESVHSFEAITGERVIIVGVDDSTSNRDSELTPDIGDATSSDYEDGTGAYFADFVVDTVMPYIEEHYNVYTDPAHTAICGSSSGGIESFYIGMEHPDRFGTIGALSPAFILFDDATWEKYLGAKDFSQNAPFVYIYNGGLSSSDTLETTLLIGASSMPGTLSKIGYPAEKVFYSTSDKALHNELYWRIVFPDFLKYMFPEETYYADAA